MEAMRKILKTEQGFSILELLIVVLMLAIVSLAINELIIKNVRSTSIERIKANLTQETLEFSKLLDDDFETCDDVKLYKYTNAVTSIPVLDENIALDFDNTGVYTEQIIELASPVGQVLVFENNGHYYVYQLINDGGKIVLVRFENVMRDADDIDGSIEDLKILSKSIATNDENIDTLFEDFKTRFSITFEAKEDETETTIIAYKIDLSLKNEKLDEPVQMQRRKIRYTI